MVKGPHPENPNTPLYFFLEGLKEVGDGSRLETAGRRVGDEETVAVGKERVARGFYLLDNATQLARLQREKR